MSRKCEPQRYGEKEAMDMIIVDIDVTDKLLLGYSLFVVYWRQNVRAM
jgi:hypothetical protein